MQYTYILAVLDPCFFNLGEKSGLGIVAGLIDEIGIVEIINSKLGIDSPEKIASGILVKAILINGLGFVSIPLYLFSFFAAKE